MTPGLAGNLNQRPTAPARQPHYGIWYNNRRLLAPIGYIPPAEAERAYFNALKTPDQAA